MPAETAPTLRRRNARYTALDLDGPTPADMIRGARSMLRDPLGWLEGAVARHGDMVALPLPRTPVLLANTPAAAARVLRENHRNYTKDTVQYGSLALVTGTGLLTADGETWRRHRRTVQPAFHHRHVEAVANATLAAAGQLRSACAAPSPAGDVDVDAACMHAMVDVVGRTLFAADLADRGGQVVAAVDVALRAILARARSPLGSGPLARMPSPSRRRLSGAVAVLDRLCADVVARRREAGVDDADGDLLGVLLRSIDGLDEREIRDELVTMVIAGHETVASSLTWTLHLLARHPQARKQLHAELDELLIAPSGTPREPSWTDLPALAWTRAVVDESLRLYPPAWVVSRRAWDGDEVDGVAVPAGTLVLISPWLLHRREQDWPDALRFDPSRFHAARTAGEPARRREGYLPFGDGPRLCIGRDVALVETTLMLAALLRDHTVAYPMGAPDPTVEALVTLRPRGGLRLRIVPR